MTEHELFRVFTGLHLAFSGKARQALSWLDSDLVELRSLVGQRARVPINPPASEIGDLARGWQAYYRAGYREAAGYFSGILETALPWLRSSACLGLGKVCTDLGFFADAAGWCQLASKVAREYEHLDLVAAAQGARGEALLRGGCPRLALEAFTLDLGLMPAGDPYRGRVLCYQGHAYQRLGAISAAKLAYRISAQLPGEGTAPYAYAGLAALGVQTGDRGLLEEAVGFAEQLQLELPQHVSIAWSYLACAREQRNDAGAFREWLRRASAALPEEYVYEGRWLKAWFALCGEPIPERVDRGVAGDFKGLKPVSPGSPEEFGPASFDGDPLDGQLDNLGFEQTCWASDWEALWVQRLRFMH